MIIFIISISSIFISNFWSAPKS